MRTFIRHASTKRIENKSGKIPVQLLKDFPQVGARGEVIRVKPAFMRSYLHINNGACYILEGQGPRIPVVKRVKQEPRKVVEVKTQPEPSKSADSEATSGAMSLDELSSLFNKMRRSRGSNRVEEAQNEATFAASEEAIGLTASEITQLVPRVHTIQAKSFPFTKKSLVDAIFSILGISVPESSIKLNGISEFSASGSYEYSIDVPGDNTVVKRSLVLRGA